MEILRRIAARPSSWRGFGLILLMVLAFAVHFVLEIQDESLSRRQQAARSVDSLSQSLHDALTPAAGELHRWAQELEAGTLPDIARLHRSIEAIGQRNPLVYGCGVALDPSWTHTRPGDLSSFFLVRSEGGFRPRAIAYDYTDTSLATALWYTAAARSRMAAWVGPYFGQAARTHFMAYARPLFVHGTFKGVFRNCAAS